MKKRAHKISTMFGFILILSFQISTVVSVALGDHDMIAMVKRLILYGICLLIPVLLIAATSGPIVSRRHQASTHPEKNAAYEAEWI